MANTKVTSRVLADDAVLTANIADDAVTSAKLDTNITVAGTLASTGALTANAGVVVDNITIDGTEIDLSSGDLTLDVAGDIILDAGGQNWYFDDDGTRVLSISQVSSDVYIGSEVSDKDMFFRGNDGGTTITALTLDMSDAGTATFNHDIILGDSGIIKLGDLADLTLYHDGSSSHIENQVGGLYLTNYANDQDIVFRSDNGAGGHTTYFYLDGSEAAHDGSSTTATYTRFPDLAYLSFGDSKDYNIRHHSNGVTYLSGTTVEHSSNTWRVKNLAGSETLINALADGAVTLYHDNTERLATSSDGIDVTGHIDSTTLTTTGNVTVGGDLTVSGSTTTLNTATLDVEDKNITLNKGSGDTSGSANGAGITIQDAVDASNDATLLWDASNDEFDFSHKVTAPALTVDDITIDGSTISDGGDFTLDVGGDISLDADGGDVLFKDGGTEVGRFLLDDNNHFKIKSIQSDADILLQGNDGGSGITALRLDMSNAGNAIFNSGGEFHGSLHLDADSAQLQLGDDNDMQVYHNGSHGTINVATGNFGVDAAGDITLDAGGGDWVLNDDGTEIGRFTNSSSDFVIKTATSDKDLIFKGNDGGSVITALTLDMSEAGWGSFNTGITLKNGMYINNADGSATSGYLYNDSDDFVIRSYTQDKDIIFKGNDGGSVITALTLDMSAAGAATFNSNVGIGAAPENAYTSYRALEMGQAASWYANTAASDANIGNNFYLDSGGNWKYKTANLAASLSFNNGNFQFYSAASGSADATITWSEKMRILAGGGITFNGDTAAANALDDYEEGTWTPVIYGATTDPSYTASTAVGDYVKIGSVVHANFLIVITAVSNAGVGNKVVSGLPFAQNQSSYQQVGLIGYNDVWTDAVTRMYMTGQNLAIMPDGVTQANYTGDVTTGYFSGCITYTTNS